MTQTTIYELHADHRHWMSEVSMWQLDFTEWHEQHQMALADLEAIAENVRQHETALKEHEQAIAELASEIKTHEHELAEKCEKDGSNCPSEPVPGHEQQAARMKQFQEAHERIKRHHHETIAKIRMVRESIAGEK